MGFVLSVATAGAQYVKDYQELYMSETQSELKDCVCSIASAENEGRKAGSEGERNAAAYVYRALREAGAQMLHGPEGDVFGVRLESGDTLRSRNVAGIIEGSGRELKDKYIVVGARLDNIGTLDYTVNGEVRTKTFYGAIGNASGLAAMIQLCRMLSRSRYALGRSVIFVAFGASASGFAGSWYFLNRSFSHTGQIEAMVNLDMLGASGGNFYFFSGSNPDLGNVISSLQTTLQPVLPKPAPLEPVPSDHQSFYGKEIPSVMFTCGMYPEYNTERDTPSVVEYDWLERETEYIYNFIIALSNAPKPLFGKSAEANSSAKEPGAYNYGECDVRPMFLNSPDPTVFLKRWVYSCLKYPQKAIDEGIQGRVLVEFIVDEKGKVGNVRVSRGVHPLLDAEAVKVVAASPDWKPARVQGRKVRCRLSVYVEFKLEKKHK